MKINSLYVFTLGVLLSFEGTIAADDCDAVNDDSREPYSPRPTGISASTTYAVDEGKAVNENAELVDADHGDEIEALDIPFLLSDAVLSQEELNRIAEEEHKDRAATIAAAAGFYDDIEVEVDGSIKRLISDVLLILKKHNIDELIKCAHSLENASHGRHKVTEDMLPKARCNDLIRFITDMRTLLIAPPGEQSQTSRFSAIERVFGNNLDNMVVEQRGSRAFIEESQRMEQEFQKSSDEAERKMKNIMIIFLVVGVSLFLVIIACYFFAFRSCVNLAHRAITVRTLNRQIREENAAAAAAAATEAQQAV